MYPMTQTKNGISALEFARQLAVCYTSTWKVKQKLMQVMKERDYRFNRRISQREMFPRLASVALRTAPRPYRVLKLPENFA